MQQFTITAPRRGIEPRSPAWQAGILTTILPRNTLGVYFFAGSTINGSRNQCDHFKLALKNWNIEESKNWNIEEAKMRFKMKKIVHFMLTPTWFEHATFWSGVRRATVAPRSRTIYRGFVWHHIIDSDRSDYELVAERSLWKQKNFQ